MPTQHDYLTTQVLTATPYQLQLMLVDAALRYVGQARGYWQSKNFEAAFETLIRAQQCIAEMVSGLNTKDHPDLAQRMTGVYLFVHGRLVDANLERSEAKLDEAVRILEIERETWRQASQRTASKLPQLTMQDGPASFGHDFVA